MCIFCEIAKKNIPSNFVYEDEKVMVIMDTNPMCDGHVLVIPKNHVEDLYEVDNEMLTHMFDVARKVATKIMKVTDENGFTVSFNYGDKQEVKHLHMHLIPNVRKRPTHTVEETYKMIME